ncbi:putative endonuclease [Cyanobacterium sp. HL-69]|uniref:YraN family protein n=1 Tax=Cyanobacterium sp. HL-69 TaxID=2054282 RepID=UPI000CA3745C|nr:putative endonuclease [Cyanobacterium sp. HL-69]
MITLGELGEKIVSTWLEPQNYQILHHRWHCRWGEIDLIALDSNNSELVFIEVKTRKPQNWDQNGLEALNINKQKKIYTTAQIFLSKNPLWQNYNCRFDLILSTYIIRKNNSNQGSIKILNSNQIMYKNHIFTIKDHLKNVL